ncbi:MAG: hypothetical protein PHW04_06110 [Candidatus Wallbacteria bacterium]|nr:hypothetical protein [Candidatus Wallbacteria bacterium]
MFNKSYVPLGIKTDYSIRKSLIKSGELALYLKKLGFTSAGLVDDNFSGHLSFYQSLMHEGIKPLIGLEVLQSSNLSPLYLFAGSNQGYLELVSILNRYFDNSKEKAVLPRGLKLTSEVSLIYPLNQSMNLTPPLDAARAFIGVDSGTKPELLELASRHGKVIFFEIISVLLESDLNFFNAYSGETNTYLKSESELKNLPPEILSATRDFADYCSFDMQKYISEVCYQLQPVPDQEFRDAVNLVSLDHGLQPEVITAELNWLSYNGLLRIFKLFYQIALYFTDNKILSSPLSGKFSGLKISYALGLNHFNLDFPMSFPSNHGLDFQINLAASKKERFLEYLRRLLPEDSLVYPLSFTHFQQYSSTREVGKNLDVPYYIADKISRKSDFSNFNLPIPREKLEKFLHFQEIFKKMVHYTARHSNAILLIPAEKNCLLPLPSDGDKRYCQFDKDVLDLLKLPKISVTGQKILDIIQDTLDLIRKKRDLILKPFDFNPADSKVYQTMIKEPFGIFFLETPRAAKLLKLIHPGCLEELLLVIGSLISGIEIRKTLTRKCFGQIIGRFHFQLIFVDHLQAIFRELGFENDSLYILEHLKKGQLPPETREKFLTALHSRVGDEAQDFFDDMCSAGPRLVSLHDICNHALLAYQTAFLKHHFFPEFMTCLLCSDCGNLQRVRRYSEVLKDKGYKFLPPDTQYSESNFTLTKNGIRIGLDNIIKSENAKCLSFEDLRDNRKAIEMHVDLCWELQKFGFFLSKHPLKKISDWIYFFPHLTISEFLTGSRQKFSGPLCLIDQSVKITKSGNRYLEYIFSDSKDEIRASQVNPEQILERSCCYYVEGEKYLKNSDQMLNLDRAVPFLEFIGITPVCFLISPDLNDNDLSKLLEFIKLHPGEQESLLIYTEQNQQIVMKTDAKVKLLPRDIKVLRRIIGVEASYLNPALGLEWIVPRNESL